MLQAVTKRKRFKRYQMHKQARKRSTKTIGEAKRGVLADLYLDLNKRTKGRTQVS